MIASAWLLGRQPEYAGGKSFLGAKGHSDTLLYHNYIYSHSTASVEYVDCTYSVGARVCRFRGTRRVRWNPVQLRDTIASPALCAAPADSRA